MAARALPTWSMFKVLITMRRVSISFIRTTRTCQWWAPRPRRPFPPAASIVYGLDDSRPVTQAMNNGYGGKGASNVVDVQGFNYNEARIDQFHKDYPNLPMVGSETASTVSTRGIYANDKDKGYVQAYDTEKPSWASTAETWWNFYDARPFLAGGFAWTGFDYRGEPTPYGWPCINS